VSSPSPVAPARPAATVVLLRDLAGEPGFEVFLVRRHDKVAFMGGAYVFPGGRLDPADATPPDLSWCDGMDVAAARFGGMPPADAVAYHVAALRELFEEAGVLLARMPSGEIVRALDAAAEARLASARAALHTSTASLPAVVGEEGLRLALDLLIPLSHWVTPEIEIKRFDTRFFVARVPPGQVPVHDERETTDSAWMRPEAALARCREGEILLPPPTWTTLKELLRFDRVDDVLAWAAGRPQIRVQPGFVRRPELTMLTLPGDPLHPALPGYEVPEDTRFVLKDGRWRAVQVGDPEVPL